MTNAPLPDGTMDDAPFIKDPVKVAVTAASGGLGQQIVETLVRWAGADSVIAVVRDPDKHDFGDVEVRIADYASQADMQAAFDGVDTVIFVSSPVGAGDRVQLHRNVINAGVKAGVRKMMYTSVIGNGSEMDTYYAPMAEVNRQTEAELQASGLEWIVGRNGLYLEFDVAHILNAVEEGVFRNNGGDGYCCYITRNELARAYAMATAHDECNNKVLNFVGEAYRQEDLVDLVNMQADTSVRYEAIDDAEVMKKIAAARGEEVARMLTGCYQAIRAGAFDVESQIEEATGMACKPMPIMIAEVVADIRAGNAAR